MVQIDVLYQGDLRCQATHGPSKTKLVTDPPLDNQGRGESFSPTDLVATALGTCMSTLMGIAAKKHGWDLVGLRVIVTKGMVADPERRIGKLAVVIHVPGEHDERARTVLERAALTCPVHKSLDPRIEIPVNFHWGSRG